MIREALSGDAAIIYNILKNTKTPWSLQGIKDSINGRDMVLLDCETSGVIIGRCICDECEILNLAVSRHMRRRGIGELLLTELEKRAAEQGAARVFLDVRETNNPAGKLYEKCGYKIIGKRKGFYSDPREDAVLMQKELL